MISIVIPYYNRRQLLINTLRSIDYFSGDIPLEVIIVDDGGTGDIDDTIDMFQKLNIRIFVSREKYSPWRSPATAYNVGFNQVRGDIVLLNSSDCLHAGDILGFVRDNMQPKTYFSFATLAAMPELTEYFSVVQWDETTIFNATKMYAFQNGWWRCHSTNRILIPFCAAINREDLEAISGYDERFTLGIGYDDCDFIDRVANLGVNMLLLDTPFCIHQHHELVQYTNDINKVLLDRLVLEEPHRVKAPNNHFYVR